MLHEEKTMKSDKLYEGKILNLRVDTIEMPDKKYSKREIIEHPGSVGIIPIVDGDSLILVKQYRKAVEDFLLEIPAGKIEINEEPKKTASRELKEETGYEAKNMKYLLEFYSSAGFTNEKISLFLAENLYYTGEEPDDGEYIEIYKYKIDDLIDMINKGEILDSKTIIAIYLAKDFIEN